MSHAMGSDFDLCRDPLLDEPTGIDAKYDDVLVDLKGEIGNISAGKVDWERVEQLATQVLSEKSKDLNALSFLTAALLQRHGFAGLADGLSLLRHWMETDWENLHPRRPARSRGFAFTWLVDRVAPYMDARQLESSEVPLLPVLQEDLQTIATIAREQLKHLAPGFGEMQNILRRFAEAHPTAGDTETDADPDETATSVTTATEDPKSATEESDTSASEAGARTAAVTASPALEVPRTEAEPPAAETELGLEAPLPTSPPLTPQTAVSVPELPPLEDNATSRDIRDRIRTLVAPLRQSQSLSPTPYRLLRTLKWQDLKGAPPADPDSGKTRLPAPRKNQRLVLGNLATNKSWPELLEASEAAYQNDTGTFWLDLHFYSALALENLDAVHGPALASLLVDELRALLERFPNLPRLTFQDGSPFANSETKRWIEETVRTVDVEVVSFGSRGEESVLGEEEIAEIQALFQSKKAQEAMDQLDQAVRRATQPRSVFRVRLTAAQLCLQANREGWARMLLDELRHNMQGFQFELWEPEMSTELYHLLALTCVRQIEKAGETPDPEVQSTLEMAQARLFALDLRAGAQVETAMADSGALGDGSGKGRTSQVAELAQLFKHLLGRS